MLQSMGLQRVGYNLVTEQQQQQYIYVCVCVCVCVCVRMPVLVAQSCLFAIPMGCSSPGSSIYRILQARILE